MIYIDSLKSHGWILRGKKIKNCHLYSNKNTLELLEFGLKIGLKPEWLQKSRSGIVHFDLTPGKRQQALLNGALEKEIYEKNPSNSPA